MKQKLLGEVIQGQTAGQYSLKERERLLKAKEK